ncbi:MAG: FAD-dependent oxidoreductase, partial [Chloroflexota bacterium]|nr:FAD-dependent oxidoreductase [Chloroflexota bacterium]
MHFVIIGNGVAGVTAARILSEAGAEVEIYAKEAYHYYPRPRLQRFLAGEMGLEDLYFYPPTWYEERGIAVHLGAKVVRLDPTTKRIVLADGREVPYARLLIAAGSSPFIPPIEGMDKGGVFSLRTVEDALAIKKWAQGAKRAVVVGGGLLGLEAARALRAQSLMVTVLERGPYLLRRQLDAEGGALLGELIGAMG